LANDGGDLWSLLRPRSQELATPNRNGFWRFSLLASRRRFSCSKRRVACPSIKEATPMKKTNRIATRKVTIHHETIRHLSSADLGRAAGGSESFSCNSCNATCVSCTTHPPKHVMD